MLLCITAHRQLVISTLINTSRYSEVSIECHSNVCSLYDMQWENALSAVVTVPPHALYSSLESLLPCMLCMLLHITQRTHMNKGRANISGLPVRTINNNIKPIHSLICFWDFHAWVLCYLQCTLVKSCFKQCMHEDFRMQAKYSNICRASWDEG